MRITQERDYAIPRMLSCTSAWVIVENFDRNLKKIPFLSVASFRECLTHTFTVHPLAGYQFSVKHQAISVTVLSGLIP